MKLINLKIPFPFAFHHQILKNIFQKKTKNYLIYIPTNLNTGDRLLGLVSSYLLSVVTRRIFLIDWETTNAFQASFFNLFNSSHLNLVQNQFPDVNFTSKISDLLDLNYCRHCGVRIPKKAVKIISNYNLIDYYTKKFLVISSNMYFVPMIVTNPFIRSMICTEFGEMPSFRILFDSVLNFSSVLQHQFNSMFLKYQIILLLEYKFEGKTEIHFQLKMLRAFLVAPLQLLKNIPMFCSMLIQIQRKWKKWENYFLVQD